MLASKLQYRITFYQYFTVLKSCNKNARTVSSAGLGFEHIITTSVISHKKPAHKSLTPHSAYEHIVDHRTRHPSQHYLSHNTD